MATSDETSWNDRIIADFHEHAGQITQGRLAGANLLLMTSIGASSGEPRTAPLGYTRDGDRFVVVGSNSGLPQQPGWLANIRANPVVSVEVGVETFQARRPSRRAPSVSACGPRMSRPSRTSPPTRRWSSASSRSSPSNGSRAAAE